MSSLNVVLAIHNSDPRDKNIVLYEEDHRYVINGDPKTEYTSVTTFCHSYFETFNADEVIKNMVNSKGWKKGHKYYGLTPDEIKAGWEKNRDDSAIAGTGLHYEIECFMNNPLLSANYTNKELFDLYMIKNKNTHGLKSPEWKHFINFIHDHPDLKPYRAEWLIYDENVKIAGSIDMVFENQDGTLSIYDWKRSKEILKSKFTNKFGNHPIICHLPDTNFWHYSMQLNTYKFILENKYGRTIKDLFLVKLHPDNATNNYEVISVPNLYSEIEELFLEREKKEINIETA
jgi:hypothetical protein